MSPEDQELWRRVTETLSPLFAPTIRPYPRRISYVGYFPTTLDLHGMTLNEAHRRTREYLSEAKKLKLKTVVIITGLSGVIRKEFEFWIENISDVRKVQIMNGGGAFKIHLNR